MVKILAYIFIQFTPHFRLTHSRACFTNQLKVFLFFCLSDQEEIVSVRDVGL